MNKYLLVFPLTLLCAFASFAKEEQINSDSGSAKVEKAEAWNRLDELLDFGWSFRMAGGPKGAAPSGERTWQTVDLPHDFQFAQPWTQKGGGARGFKASGTEGVYRKELALDPSWKGKTIQLSFEAIMCRGDVKVDGRDVGSCEYGYLGLTTDIAPAIDWTKKSVLIEVRAQTGSGKCSRWYTGGGLIRDVHLIVKSAQSFQEDGLFIRTPRVTDAEAEVVMDVQLDGCQYLGRTGRLAISGEVLSPEGASIAQFKIPVPNSKLKHQTVKLPDVKVKNPERWDLDTPRLYTVKLNLFLDGQNVDQISDRFGIRTLEYGPDFGFRLNGRKVFLNGMANHHDLGALGAAAFDRGIRRQFATMKRFGYNTIRCAHCPYSRSFYRLADEMGLLVIDELTDKWRDSDGRWMGRKPFKQIWTDLYTKWVKRDRNHPSVILWSLGNELQMADDGWWGWDFDDWAVTGYRMIDLVVKRWDPTRLTTVANFPARKEGMGKRDKGFMDVKNYDPPELACVTDIAAFNYQPQAYAEYKRRVPHLIILQSEATSSELQWPYCVMNHAQDVGCCYWGAIEYWGESNRWPKKGWTFSFFRHTLEPMPPAYLIESVMTDRPVCHIGIDEGGETTNWNDVKVGMIDLSENWNRKPGEKCRVYVFANADEVELFRNGTSFGVQKNNRADPHKVNMFVFAPVTWQPGRLEAVARTVGADVPDGPREIARYAIETTGAPVALKVTAENPNDWKADGLDLQYIRVAAVDAEGREVPDVKGRVRFAVEGAATFFACDNGDQYTDELFTPDISAKDFYKGTVQAVLRATRAPGKVKVTVSCEGGLPGRQALPSPDGKPVGADVPGGPFAPVTLDLETK